MKKKKNQIHGMRGALQAGVGVATSRAVLMKQSKTWLVNYIIALSYFFKQFPMTGYLKQVRDPKSSYWDYKAKLPRLRTIRQKALPKRKTKRKFSKKQLAAQRLFAKRARAGTLRRRA